MDQCVVQKLDKAIASINKGADKKEEMRLTMAPYADWDRFLSPAPLSIALLGQLILVTTDTDFSLQDKKESIQFKFLKYPDSFRASLVQVSNSGWGAFNKAHTCMDQIRLYSGNVDKHVKTAVKFLISGSPQEVELMVPDALKSIDNIADECLELATSVEKEFVFIMEMIAELLEACTSAKGEHEQDVKDAEIAIKVAEEHKKALEQEKQQAEEKKKEMVRQMKEAEQEYKDAMESLPTTFSIIMTSCAEAYLDWVRILPNLASSMTASSSDNIAQASQYNVATPQVNSSMAIESENKYVFKLVPAIRIQITALVDLACGGKNSEGKDEPKWNEIAKPSRGATRIKLKLERIVNMKLQSAGESEMKEKVEKLCLDGVAICDTLLELQKEFNKDQKELEDVLTSARNLWRDVEIISAVSHSLLGSNSLPNKPPHLSKKPTTGDNSGIVKSVIESRRFKTEAAKETLKDARHLYDKSCDDVARMSKETGNILAELADYNLKKTDHETIRKTLIKGIKALAELREQWGKLVQFFQKLSNLVKCCLHTSMKTFVQMTQKQKKLSEAGSVMSDTMRDVIYEQAFQANQIAYVVNSISSAYVEVSEKHLMDRITCLGKLIALDPVRDEREITLKREELNEGCKEAQDAIRRIAVEKKEQMMEALDKRIGRIESEVEAVLPPISEIEAKDIEDRVKAGVAMGKAAMEEEVNEWT